MRPSADLASTLQGLAAAQSEAVASGDGVDAIGGRVAEVDGAGAGDASIAVDPQVGEVSYRLHVEHAVVGEAALQIQECVVGDIQRAGVGDTRDSGRVAAAHHDLPSRRGRERAARDQAAVIEHHAATIDGVQHAAGALAQAGVCDVEARTIGADQVVVGRHPAGVQRHAAAQVGDPVAIVGDSGCAACTNLASTLHSDAVGKGQRVGGRGGVDAVGCGVGQADVGRAADRACAHGDQIGEVAHRIHRQRAVVGQVTGQAHEGVVGHGHRPGHGAAAQRDRGAAYCGDQAARAGG